MTPQANLAYRIATLEQLLDKWLSTSGGAVTQDALASTEDGATLSEQLRAALADLRADSQVLLHAHRQSRELFDLAPEAYLVTDAAAHIQNANVAACRLLNQSRSVLQGASLFTFVAQADRPALQMQLERLIQGEAAWVQEWEMTLRPFTSNDQAQTTLPASVSISAGHDAAGDAVSIRWLLRDLSSQKQSQNELQRYAQRLAVLYELDQAILANHTPETIAHAALSHLRWLVPYTRASVATFDFESQTGSFLAAYYQTESQPGGSQFVLTDLSSLEALQQGEVHIVQDLAQRAQPSPEEARLRAAGVRAYLQAPLMAESEVLGSLTLAMDTPQSFTQEHIDIAREVAAEIALAIFQARLREQVMRHTTMLEQLVAQRTADLQHERNFVTAILEMAGPLVIVLDKDGHVVRFNQACERITGYPSEAVVGKLLWELPILLPEDLPGVQGVFADIVNGRFPNEYENDWIARNGRRRLIAWSNSAIVNEQGEVSHVIAIGVDVTTRRQMEEALRESEEFSQTVLNSLPAHVAVLDKTGAIVAVNAAWRSFAQTNGGDWSQVGPGVNYLDVCSRAEGEQADEAATAASGIAAILAGQRNFFFLEYPCHSPEKQRWFMLRASPLSGREGGAVVSHIDITARQKIEVERTQLLKEISQQRSQLRHLAQRVVLAQEDERSRVARELHDEAGQALTALKYSLSATLAELPSSELSTAVELPDIKQRLQKAVSLCDTTMAQIRLIAHNLRPTTLDNVGLNLTLEGFCHDFAERTGLIIDYAGTDVLSLGNAVDITLYRILQEALTNVAKHAQAKQVWVALNVDGNEVSLSIEDDGQGFTHQAEQQTTERLKGVGLLGIRERLESFGGLLEIDSRPGRGALIVSHIPMAPAPKTTRKHTREHN